MASAGRRRVIAGNWKMHKTVREAVALVEELRPLAASVGQKVELLVAPPFTALHAVAKALEGQGVPLGVAAQNCFWEPSGAFTGEVSPDMLREAGCRYVILGHSERRQYFGETDETVNRRVRAALKDQLGVIICIGEVLADRDAGQTLPVVTRQLQGALAGVGEGDMSQVVIAYEPVWAIGTGRVATAAQAQEVHAHLRAQLARLYRQGVAEATRIQYGGSVKPDNAAELLRQPDVDGALVGGASLKATDFAGIVKACA